MDSYYFKWWRLFQLLLSGNACPAFGATPHRRALRLVAASSVIRLIRFVAPPLPNTRGVSGTPNLIYALPQNSSQDCFDLRDALTLISRHGRLRFQYSLTLLVIIKITGTPKRCPCYFNMVETISASSVGERMPRIRSVNACHKSHLRSPSKQFSGLF